MYEFKSSKILKLQSRPNSTNRSGISENSCSRGEDNPIEVFQHDWNQTSSSDYENASIPSEEHIELTEIWIADDYSKEKVANPGRMFEPSTSKLAMKYEKPKSCYKFEDYEDDR